jgi:hypothetical protein
VQQYDYQEGRYCNCTHVGGDAETERPTVEACISEAELAGANVVNFVGTIKSTTPTSFNYAKDEDTDAPIRGRQPASLRPAVTPSPVSRGDSKKTYFGCFYKKCSVAMLWSGRVDTAEYEPSGPTDGLTGFDVHVLSLNVAV